MGFAFDPKVGLGIPTGSWKKQERRSVTEYYRAKRISGRAFPNLKIGEYVLFFNMYDKFYQLPSKVIEVKISYIRFLSYTGRVFIQYTSDYNKHWFIVKTIGGKEIVEAGLRNGRNI